MSKNNRYKAWWQMCARCFNPSHSRYADYGGRGISVCPAWLDFETYYADTGEPPIPTHTLDRIDNDGDYGPDNWKWSTKAEQAQNRRYCHHLTFEGKTQTASEWARDLDIKVETVIWRVKAGWSIEAILAKNGTGYHKGKFLSYEGVTKTLSEWSAQTGLGKTTINARLKRGWSVGKALTPDKARGTLN